MITRRASKAALRTPCRVNILLYFRQQYSSMVMAFSILFQKASCSSFASDLENCSVHFLTVFWRGDSLQRLLMPGREPNSHLVKPDPPCWQRKYQHGCHHLGKLQVESSAGMPHRLSARPSLLPSRSRRGSRHRQVTPQPVSQNRFIHNLKMSERHVRSIMSFEVWD